jgi:hypothetical protein
MLRDTTVLSAGIRDHFRPERARRMQAATASSQVHKPTAGGARVIPTLGSRSRETVIPRGARLSLGVYERTGSARRRPPV